MAMQTPSRSWATVMVDIHTRSLLARCVQVVPQPASPLTVPATGGRDGAPNAAVRQPEPSRPLTNRIVASVAGGRGGTRPAGAGGGTRAAGSGGAAGGAGRGGASDAVRAGGRADAPVPCGGAGRRVPDPPPWHGGRRPHARRCERTRSSCCASVDPARASPLRLPVKHGGLVPAGCVRPVSEPSADLMMLPILQ